MSNSQPACRGENWPVQMCVLAQFDIGADHASPLRIGAGVSFLSLLDPERTG